MPYEILEPAKAAPGKGYEVLEPANTSYEVLEPAVPSQVGTRLTPEARAKRVGEIRNEIEAKSSPSSPLAGKLLGALGSLAPHVEPFTPQGIANQPQRLANLIYGADVPDPFKSGDEPTLPLVDSNAPVPQGAVGGATRSVAEGLQGLTSPNNAAFAAATLGMAPAAQAGSALLQKIGPMIGKAVMSYFATKAVTEGIPQAAGEVSVKAPNVAGELAGTLSAPTGVTPGESAKSLFDLAQQVLVGAGATGGAFHETPRVTSPVAEAMERRGVGINPKLQDIVDESIAMPKKTFTSTAPLIGQEEPVTAPKVSAFGPSVGQAIEDAFKTKGIEPAVGFAGEAKQGGQVSFEGQGIPSAGQAEAMVPNNPIRSRDQLSGVKMFSGVPIDPDVLKEYGRIVAAGFKGDSGVFNTGPLHQWVKGMPTTQEGINKLQQGFITGKGKFITRQQAEDLYKVMPFSEDMNLGKDKTEPMFSGVPLPEGEDIKKASAAVRDFLKDSKVRIPVFIGMDEPHERIQIGKNIGTKVDSESQAKFFTDSPMEASFYMDANYGAPGTMQKVWLNLKNPMEIDAKGADKGRAFGGIGYGKAIQIAKQKGFDGIIVRNIKDASEVPQTTYIAFKDNQIVNAISQKRDAGGELYSGIPLPSFDDVKDVSKAALNTLFGHKVDRSLHEGLKALAYDEQGYSAPKTSAANEEVGNALNRAAAARIAAKHVAKVNQPNNITAQVAEANRYTKQTLRETEKALVDAGLADYTGPKRKAPVIGGRPSERVGNLWVRTDLKDEVKQAFEGGALIDRSARKMLLNTVTSAQVAGPTDFVYHTANMYGTIAYSQGKGSVLLDALAKTAPGYKHVDTVARVGWEVYRSMMDSPEVRKELADIAKINALRGDFQQGKLISKVPVVGKYLDSSYWIHIVDKAGRLARNKMFDNLVKYAGAEDSEFNRREFINKMGQYNDRSMSVLRSNLKGTVAPFIVATSTMNRNGFHRVMLMNEVRTTSPAAYARMKALNVLGFVSTVLTFPVVVNTLLNGNPFPKGVPIGMIGYGKDKDGRWKLLDPLQTQLLRRGARITGGQELAEGVREGKKPGEITDKMMQAIINGVVAPFAGPPLRFLYTLASGREFRIGGGGGRVVSKDADSTKENLKAAIINSNPMSSAMFAEHFGEGEASTGAKAGKYFERLGGAVGIKKGNLPSHVDKVKAKEAATDMPKGISEVAKRVHAEREVAKETPSKTEKQVIEGAKYALDKERKLGEELTAALPKPLQEFAKKEGFRIPSYDGVLHEGKVRVVLDEKEAARLKELLVDGYTKAGNVLMSRDWSKVTAKQKQIQADELFTMQKHRAENALRREMNASGPKLGQDKAGAKKPRFSFLRSLVE